VKKKQKINGLKFLEPVEIQGLMTTGLKTRDIVESLGPFTRPPGKNLFLNRYSEEELMEVMRGAGLVEFLKRRGFTPFQLSMDMDEESVYSIKVFSGGKSPENMLIDLRLSESRFVPDRGFLDQGTSNFMLDLVIIQWLSLRNPRESFTMERPQLPGQEKPGLGGLKYMMKMMHTVAEGILKDGFLDMPDHLHGAIMYSKNFKFFNPTQEAIIKSIMRDLAKNSLYDISWGILTGTVLDQNTGQPYIYEPSEQVFPVSGRLKEYFTSPRYTSRYKEVFKSKKYMLDIEAMVKKREEILQITDAADL
jgi:hypothetical protein